MGALLKEGKTAEKCWKLLFSAPLSSNGNFAAFSGLMSNWSEEPITCQEFLVE